jgi:hypothetical protein
MGNIFSLRIVQPGFKLVYVVVAFAVAVALSRGLEALGVSVSICAPISMAVLLVTFLYGARVFRGPDEEVARPRPWWKMTSKRTLSTLLAFLFGLLGVAYGAVSIALFVEYFRFTERDASIIGALADDAIYLSLFVFSATLAFFYIVSTVRLPIAVKLKGSFARPRG